MPALQLHPQDWCAVSRNCNAERSCEVIDHSSQYCCSVVSVCRMNCKLTEATVRDATSLPAELRQQDVEIGQFRRLLKMFLFE